MSLFCFLWMPLFYLFWRSISVPAADSGGILALILGSAAACIRFFLGALVHPGAFGLSRWLSACIDIVTLPAILPLLVCFLLSRLRILPGTVNYTGFALLWLIPGGVSRAISWSAQNDPALLVLTPVLWTAIAVGVPLFMKRRIPGVIAVAALPILAATAYWAFFSQKTWLGFLLLAVTLIPMGVSVAASFYRSCENS
jgi:hypothetical protein